MGFISLFKILSLRPPNDISSRTFNSIFKFNIISSREENIDFSFVNHLWVVGGVSWMSFVPPYIRGMSLRYSWGLNFGFLLILRLISCRNE